MTQATLDGKRVVVVRHEDGSKVYVANTGVPYLLRGDDKGVSATRIVFTEYGADFRITAPDDAVDIADFVDRE